MANQPKARVKQIHGNNLKIYHKRGHPFDNGNISTSEDDNDQQGRLAKQKRTYRKNPECKRWEKSRTNNQVYASHTNESESDSHPGTTDQESNDEENDESSDFENLSAKTNSIKTTLSSKNLKSPSRPRGSKDVEANQPGSTRTRLGRTIKKLERLNYSTAH